MKVEEYEQLINKMISEPDNAGETGKSILDAIRADDTARVADAETIKAQKAKISELNSAIFMSATGKPPDAKEEHEETPKEMFNRLFDERFYGGNKNGTE